MSVCLYRALLISYSSHPDGCFSLALSVSHCLSLLYASWYVWLLVCMPVSDNNVHEQTLLNGGLHSLFVITVLYMILLYEVNENNKGPCT